MKALLSTTAAAALLLGATGAAHATLELSSVINGITFFCFDNTACDTDPTPGVLQVGNQNFGGVTVAGSIQEVSTAGGQLSINTSSLTVTNNTASTANIKVVVSATDFPGPATNFDASASATFQADVGGTLSVAYYDDPANRLGDINSVFGDLLATGSKTVTANPDSFSQDVTGVLVNPDTGAFSMSLVAAGDLISGGEIVNRGQALIKTNAVPEPASLGILGAGLFGFGLIRRRRSRKGGLANA